MRAFILGANLILATTMHVCIAVDDEEDTPEPGKVNSRLDIGITFRTQWVELQRLEKLLTSPGEIREISIEGSRFSISDKASEMLATKLIFAMIGTSGKRIETLYIQYLDGFDHRALSLIGKMPSLRFVNFSNCRSLSTEALIAFLDGSKVRTVVVSKCPMVDVALLSESFKNVEFIYARKEKSPKNK